MTNDRQIDEAIGTAAERTREAEERLVEQPIGSPDAVSQAERAEHFAEDLDVLAEEAVDLAEPDAGGRSGR